MITTRDLGVTLSGRPILSGLDLAFAPGAVTAVVGPNGAGKSTLLACLAGLRRPTRGGAFLDSRDLAAMPGRERAQKIAFLEQSPQVAWAVDVRTLVGLGRTPFIGARGMAEEDRAAVDAALERVGMTAFADRLTTTLSGGERARVFIARALAGSPDWLLVDEPLAGLDIGHQFDAVDLFRALAAEGRGVVVTVHELGVAARLADRVIVLAEGRIAADGPPIEALTPAVLAEAYGVEATVTPGTAGLLIEIVGRAV